ncbi:MAG: 50S ribosomal protein L34 [Planctomycetota bacterium]|nr:MAG: 50S ribosomal protein L34 [Planctomycetota bacterium]
MHYPRRISRIKKLRKQGFRTRMRTSRGRKLLNRQRRKGKHSLSVNV